MKVLLLWVLLVGAAEAYDDALVRVNSIIELKNIERDKYFRLLADVYVDQQNLGNMLPENKLAVPWEGRRSSHWCSAEASVAVQHAF